MKSTDKAGTASGSLGGRGLAAWPCLAVGWRFLAALVVIVSSVSPVRGGAALDAVVFGDAASESAHGFTSDLSETYTGALGESARRLLPRNPVGVNGGALTFTLAVDPARRNHVSVKLWGGDDTDDDIGRLYLNVPLDGVEYQVGYRHEGDYMPLSVAASRPPLPGRFFYSTTLLPLWMTRGRTSLTVRIVATGRLYGLGSGGPPTGNYQYGMTMKSRGIYRAYTHVEPMLEPAGEVQGAAPATTVRPAVSESSILGLAGTYTTGLNNWIRARLAAAPGAFTTTDVELLGKAHVTPQTTAGYQNPALISKMVAVIDGFCADYYANPSTSPGTSNYGGNGGNEVWGGRFGAIGWAVHLTTGALAPYLDVEVDYGVGGVRTRRAAWGDMLAASRDYGRFNRRTITNQTLIADSSIYKANRGLQALSDPRAFTELQAQRYLREACGLAPWMGSDLPGGGSAMPYGSGYLQVTPKGLSREWGYVGGYGEMQIYAATFYQWTGNAEFRDQAVRMIKARAAFRRPAIEVSGSSNFRCMERIGLISWRGVRESDGDFANDINYGDAVSWSAGARVAGRTADPHAVGYAKQMLADNQYFGNLVADSRYFSNPTFDARMAFEVWDDYNALKSAPDSGIRLPMSDGEPDFAWADEVAGVLAIKRGSERLWIAPFYQAKAGTGINGIARFHRSTATFDQYGVMETTPRFKAGGYFVRPDLVDKPEANTYLPPDAPVNAYAGEMLPLGVLPRDSRDPAPFRGVVDSYVFRFGRYLVGMNASSKSFGLRVPQGMAGLTNLVSGGAPVVDRGEVVVPSASTVVLELPSTSDPAPVPNAPLCLLAAGSAAPSVSLQWSEASGAESYTVKRSKLSGGPYEEVAGAVGINATRFTDAGVSAGSAWHYIVTASNANGESLPSAEASASAGLPDPWSSTDVGAVSLPGSSSFLDRAFTLSGTGSDVGGTLDSCQFASVPVMGDGVITARLASRLLGGTSDDKVGLMIRGGESAGAVNFAVFVDAFVRSGAANRARASYRSSAQGGTNLAGEGPVFAIPGWLRIERRGANFSAFVSDDGLAWTAIGSASLANMPTNANFGLFVCSRDALAANTSVFEEVSVPGWVAPPSGPTGLAAVPGDSRVTLDWNGVPDARYYKVMRASDANGRFSVIGCPASPDFVDDGLGNGVIWHYRVSAVTGAGEGASSVVVAVAAQRPPPGEVANIRTAVGAGRIVLTWAGSADADAYRISRASSPNGPFVEIGMQASNVFVDDDAADGVPYSYRVVAVNDAGEGSSSAVVTAVASVGGDGTWAVPPAAAKPDVTTKAGNPDLVLSSNPFAAGDLVQVSAGFSGVTAGRYYWVVQSSGLVIRLAAVSGGSPITPTASGTTNAALRSSQSWRDGSNWVGSVIAGGVDALAVFPVSSPAVDVAAVVVDSDTTLGKLSYRNSSSVADFTLATAPESTLQFAVSGVAAGQAMPVIDVPQSTNRRLNLGERDNAALRLVGNQGLLIRSSPGGTPVDGIGANPLKEVTLFRPDWSGFTGGLVVDRGSMGLPVADRLPRQTLTLGTASSLMDNVLAGISLTSVQTIDGLVGNGNGRVAGSESLTVGAGGGGGVFGGVFGRQFNGIKDATSLVKTGSGRQELTGAFTGNGSLGVQGGTLVLGGGEVHDVAGAVTVTSGRLLVNGRFEARPPWSAATLSGVSGSTVFKGSTVFRNGDLLRVTSAGAGLAAGMLVHVVNTPTASDSVQVSATPDGGAIAAGSTATASVQWLTSGSGSSGAVAIQSGALLGGTGLIRPFDTTGAGSAITVAGRIAPGDPVGNDGIGTLFIDGTASARRLLEFTPGAAFEFDLRRGGGDRLALTGCSGGDVLFQGGFMHFRDRSGGALPTGEILLIAFDHPDAIRGLVADADGVITDGLWIGGGLEAYEAASLKLRPDGVVLSLTGNAPIAATVLLNGLARAYSGGPQAVEVATDPPGLEVSIRYAGSSTPPSAPGAYLVEAVVIEPGYSGTATGTLVIRPPISAEELRACSLRSVSPPEVWMSETVPGRTYQLQRAIAPGISGWDDLGTPLSGTGGGIRFEDPAPPPGRAFYRVRITP